MKAARLVEHVDDGNRHFLLFSPANVVLWRMSSALERGEHAIAAALADTIRPTDLSIDSRRTTYLIERARALHGLRQPDEEVIRLLVQAEKLGPVRTRANPLAREIVGLITRSGGGQS